MAERVLTVSQLNEYVSNVLTRDPVLRRLSLGGEVSNWRQAPAMSTLPLKIRLLSSAA